MQIASTKSGESLDQLANRVYAFPKKPSKTALRTAATALAEANPFLRRAAEIPSDAQIIVPPLEQADPGAGAQPADAVTAAAVLDGLTTLIEQTTGALLDDVNADVDETKESISTMRSQRLARLARDSGVTEDLHEARAAAKQRVADAKELQRHHSRVVDQVAKDLAEMRSALEGETRSATARNHESS
jgi:phage tail protein X